MSQGAGLLGRGLSALGTCLAPGRSLDTDHRVTEAQGPPGHPQLVWGRADVKVAEWQGGAGEAGEPSGLRGGVASQLGAASGGGQLSPHHHRTEWGPAAKPASAM